MMRKCAILQFEAVHEITIPFVVDILNKLGWEPDVYINDRCLVRGDLFQLSPNLQCSIKYVPVASPQDWRDIESGLTNSNYEFVFSNTCQLPGTIKFLNSINLPTLGLVHNAELFLKNEEGVGFAKKRDVHLYTLWDHISAKLRSGLPHRSDNICTLRQSYVVADEKCRFGAPVVNDEIKIAVTGAIDGKIRDLSSLVNLGKLSSMAGTTVKILVCGGGPDRETVLNEIRDQGYANNFEFIDLDEERNLVPYDAYFKELAKVDFIATMLPARQRSYLEYKITSGILTALGMGIPLIMDKGTSCVYDLPGLTVSSDFNECLAKRLTSIRTEDFGKMHDQINRTKQLFLQRNIMNLRAGIEHVTSTQKRQNNVRAETTVKEKSRNVDDFLALAETHISQSSSQRLQDLWAFYESGLKTEGYFVEFGALNGQDVSNSWMLEKLGWDGIAAEPHPAYADMLKGNRNCSVSTDCVYSVSGETVVFKAVQGRPALSTISMDNPEDSADKNGRRDKFSEHKLTTISLVDLLKKYHAPKNIDFLSIDTEGSEYAILSAFDFSAYRINTICVEHNHTEHRELIEKLLTSNGYQRVLDEISGHDDWYVLDGAFAKRSDGIAVLGSLPAVNNLERRLGVLASISLKRREFKKCIDFCDTALKTMPDYAEALTIKESAKTMLETESQPKNSELPKMNVQSTAVAGDTLMLKQQYKSAMAMMDGFISRFATENAKGKYTRAVHQLFYKMALDPRVTKTLEIGAYEAGFSRKIKSTRPNIECLAFEANPYVYDRFKQEALDAGVDYRNNCVNADGGEICVRIPLDYRGSDRELTNQMTSIMQNTRTENTKEVMVPGICPDQDLVFEPNDRLVAWIDVEGACGAVLPGCVKTLEQCAAVFIEVESKEIWENQWLDSDVAVFFDQIGFYPIAKDYQSPQQYNVVYLNSRFELHLNAIRNLWATFDRICENTNAAAA